MAIDSQGTLLAVHVRAANKADGAEAGAVMVQACERHPSIESFTADASYQREAEQVAREQLGVEFHVTAKSPSLNDLADATKRATGRGIPRHRQAQVTQAEPPPAQKGGSSPVRFRWRIERTFAWLGQCRLLSKEYEKTIKSAEAWLWCAMMRLLV